MASSNKFPLDGGVRILIKNIADVVSTFISIHGREQWGGNICLTSQQSMQIQILAHTRKHYLQMWFCHTACLISINNLTLGCGFSQEKILKSKSDHIIVYN